MDAARGRARIEDLRAIWGLWEVAVSWISESRMLGWIEDPNGSRIAEPLMYVALFRSLAGCLVITSVSYHARVLMSKHRSKHRNRDNMTARFVHVRVYTITVRL